MEAHEQILELMDSFWFQHRIIFRNNHKEKFHNRKIDDEIGEKSSRIQNLQIRSFSDRCIGVGFEADSPTSVIVKPKKLQKIPSGEEIPFFGEGEKSKRERRERGMSRSLSALEFEELKGFMDLGFVFNEEVEMNPSLVSIVPGLQKWKKMTAGAAGEEEEIGKGRVSRPYLSEAWGDMCRRRGNDGKKVINNWKIPSVRNEIDMKDHLKNWAHVVASTVR